MPEQQWKIQIIPTAGYASCYWENTYPSFGRSGQAGAMQNVDMIDPTKLTQGPDLATLTAGTQAGAVTTLIRSILSVPVSDNVTFGIGGAKLQKISATAVTNDATFPHTIDKGTVTGEDGESIVYLNDYLYYFFNHSGSAGDIGRLTVSTNTFDDDWGATVPTGAAALTNNPHPSIKGADGIIYFGNGRYVGYYDQVTNTLSADELDLPLDEIVVDLVWENNSVWIATNRPNLATGNTNEGVLRPWDTVASSWGDPEIVIQGKIGALHRKNGRVFVFYQDLSSSGGFKLGYINGNTIQELEGFSGTLPLYYQVTDFKNMIAFVSNGLVHLWGATSAKNAVALSQYMDGGFATIGALACPFGTLMVASNETTSYKLAQASGYDVNCNWKSLMFDVSVSIIDKIRVHYETIATGARVDLTLRYDRGASTYSVGSISYTNESGKIRKTFYPRQEVSDFRLEFDWSLGSASNPLAIRKVEVFGHNIGKD